MEELSKRVLLVGSALYVIGLLAQNVVLATVGASDLLLLKARGIFVGLWVVLIFLVMAAAPVWAMAPWLTGASRENPPRIRGRLIVVVLGLLAPASFFWILGRAWFRETAFISFVDSLTALRITALAVLGGAGLLLIRRLRKDDPPHWGWLLMISAITCAVITVFVQQASYEIVILIPAQYGGARAELLRLVVKPETGRLFSAAGVQFTQSTTRINPASSPGTPASEPTQIVTVPLKLIDETDSYLTVVLPLANGQRVYFSSLTLKKSDLLGVITEPSSGSKSDKNSWENTPIWPPK